MVFKRTETSHKFFRTPSRILCNQNLLQEQGSSTCQTADGQCVSSSLHQQNGGYPFPNSSQFGYRPLELVPRPQNTCVGRKPTKSSELEGRQRISSDNRLQRLEIESSIFQNPCLEMGTFVSSQSRSLCLPTNFPITTVCELEIRPSCRCHRCFLNELGGHQGLCFSSICPHRTLFATGNDAECRQFSVSSSSMASQPWYPVLLHLAVDKPLLLPVTPELLMKDDQEHPLTNLQLAGWVLSASAIKDQVFRN